ncbi:nitrilase-related carbon-nitrogen hydrolase [Alistipes sp. AF48-12]|uniref:nitrilase-related carbon-nitrogen hydrolase n=1 Tax=Alistipes sp. AF48-12 TaxID=2291998 RepID=UPI0021750E9E|nr:nitrilase-related carbon-nitrogen hydrolase [Alistipes sp. AF48-12]
MAPVYRLTGAKIEIKFNKTIGKLNFTSGLKVLSLRHLLKLKATNVMKIALAQLNYTIGDFDSNRKKIVECIDSAKSQSAQLIVFAEQAISGAPAYDLLNKVSFLDLCEETLRDIASHCENISVLIGLPVQCSNKTISVAALIENKKNQTLHR